MNKTITFSTRCWQALLQRKEVRGREGGRGKEKEGGRERESMSNFILFREAWGGGGGGGGGERKTVSDGCL